MAADILFGDDGLFYLDAYIRIYPRQDLWKLYIDVAFCKRHGILCNP